MEQAIKKILSCRSKACIEDARMKRAAVLIPLFEKGGEVHILFTRRTQQVPHHKGQISFPGGRWDEGDESLLATALRESSEELGITPRDVRVLGELDDICTVSDFCVSPFVGVIPYPYPFRVNPREIDEIIEVPFSALRDERSFSEGVRRRDGIESPVYFYRHLHHLIWGATARILKQFLELLEGEKTGVRSQKSEEEQKEKKKNSVS